MCEIPANVLAIIETTCGRGKYCFVVCYKAGYYRVASRAYRLSHFLSSCGFLAGLGITQDDQPIFSGEFNLLEIGDDVVFGSLTCIMCTTKDSCEKVIFCAGSNVADNSFGGSILGKSAMLGSNSICPEGWYLSEGSVWFGSTGGEPTCLEKGVEGDLAGPLIASEVEEDKLQFNGDDSTLTPFGRTFYQRKAPYLVYWLDDHYVYLDCPDPYSHPAYPPVPGRTPWYGGTLVRMVI